MLRALLPILIFSANAASAAPLTWPRAIELLKQNNADLKSAEATFRSTRAQEGVARSGFLPDVSAELDYSRGSKSDAGNDDGTYSATLKGSQNLFSGGLDYAKVKQAKANTSAAGETLRITKAKISYELTQAFEGAVYAREYRKLTEEIIRRRSENLRLVQLRFQSGRENQGSVLLSKAYLEQAKYEDLQAQNSERVAQSQLARSLGLDSSEPQQVDGDVPVQEPAVTPQFKDLVLQTPTYIQATAQQESKEFGVTAARAGFLPTLSLNGTTGDQGGNFYPHEKDQWSVGVNLTLPLFSGGKDYYSTRAASQDAVSATAATVNVRRETAVKLEQAYANYVESVSRLKVDHSFRDATQVRAEIARKKYNNGLMTFDDWDVIENDLISREKAYKQSQRDRVLAEAAWQQALGKGVLE